MRIELSKHIYYVSPFYDDNTMFLIRVAHENSLRGAQAIVSTETNYNRPTKAIGVLEPSVGEKTTIQLKEEALPQKPLKNISTTLSFELDDEDELIEITNVRVPASYRDVYQLDSKGNRNYSNELCLLLSDVADQSAPVIVKTTDGGQTIEPSKYQTNWFYGEGYATQSVVVLSPSAGVVENRNCDVEFSIKQLAKRAYGTASQNKVILPIVIKSNGLPDPDDGDDDPDSPDMYYSAMFSASDDYTVTP